MKLVVGEVSPWPVQTVGGKPLDLTKELSLIITPMEDLPERWGRWRDRVLRVGLPPTVRADVTAETETTSVLEWPVRVIDTTIVDGNERVLEARITVLYFLLEWCAAVVVRGTPSRVASERARAMRVALSGRPDWSRPEVPALSLLRARAES